MRTCQIKEKPAEQTPSHNSTCQLKVLFDDSSLQALLTTKHFSHDLVPHTIRSSPDRYPRPRYLQHIQISLGFTYTDSCNRLPQPFYRDSPAKNLASVAFLNLGGGLYICFTQVSTKLEPCDQGCQVLLHTGTGTWSRSGVRFT